MILINSNSLFNVSIFLMTSLSFTFFPFLFAYSTKNYRFFKLTDIEIADIVIDVMADSLLVIDRNNIIIKVNKSTLDLLGFNNKNELMNVPLKDIVKFPHFKSNILSKISAGNNVENIETEFITKEKKMIPMNISASSIYNENRGFEEPLL
jgi:PAS domain S-box-containing protein